MPVSRPEIGYRVTALGPRGRQAGGQLRPREELFGWKIGAQEGWS
jgi:hypothetical protein